MAIRKLTPARKTSGNLGQWRTPPGPAINWQTSVRSSGTFDAIEPESVILSGEFEGHNLASWDGKVWIGGTSRLYRYGR